MVSLFHVIIWIVWTILIIWAIRWYHGRAKCKSQKKLNGKVVIVTGGNTGIGKETARDLAKRGARVILACRDTEKGKRASEEIAKDIGEASSNNLKVYKLDLASLASIRHFAEEFLKNEDRLDILVNNAGLGWVDWTTSEDGFEIVMGTNHLGHFLLTNLLLDKLKSCAPSRIVNVSSMAYKMMFGDKKSINLEAITDQETFSKWRAYPQSKLANILFTHELTKRLEGTGVTANSLHPGLVHSEFSRYILPQSFPLLLKLCDLILKVFAKTSFQGAQTSIHCAVAEELETVSGKYFSDCDEEKLEPHATDENEAKRLWDYSAKVTHLTA